MFNAASPTNGQHLHHCYELCIVTNGEGMFRHGKSVYALNKGDIFIADPGIAHEISVTEDQIKRGRTLELVFYVIEMGVQNNQDPKGMEANVLNDFMNGHNIATASKGNILNYVSFVEQYFVSTSRVSPFVQPVIKSQVLECLDALTTVKSNNEYTAQTTNTIVDAAIGYIGQNLTHKLFAEDIAAKASTSVRNLQYHFRKHLGCTLVDYINKRRMSVAAGYLKMNFKVNEIGAKVGIHDPAQFCRVFKKHYGLSPKSWQQRFMHSEMNYGAVFCNEDP